MNTQAKKERSQNIFCERLQTALEIRGMSQYQLSKHTGISQSTISRWKKSAPHGRTVEAVANAISVRKAWLLSGEGEMDLPTDAELDAQVDAQLAAGPSGAAAAMDDQELVEEVDGAWAALKVEKNPRKRAARAETILAYLTELHRRDLLKK